MTTQSTQLSRLTACRPTNRYRKRWWASWGYLSLVTAVELSRCIFQARQNSSVKAMWTMLSLEPPFLWRYQTMKAQFEKRQIESVTHTDRYALKLDLVKNPVLTAGRTLFGLWFVNFWRCWKPRRLRGAIVEYVYFQAQSQLVIYEVIIDEKIPKEGARRVNFKEVLCRQRTLTFS